MRAILRTCWAYAAMSRTIRAFAFRLQAALSPRGAGLFAALAVLALCALPAWSQEAGGQAQWKSFDSAHCVVSYTSDEAIKKFDENVVLTPEMLTALEFLTLGAGKSGNPLGAKLDFIFERAQTLLDMKVNMAKVHIYIYENFAVLQVVFGEYYGAGKRAVPRSWYMFEHKAVFVNLEDINTGILAHEMSHHIIDHYLSTRPDAGSAELLAIFVEKNFFK